MLPALRSVLPLTVPLTVIEPKSAAWLFQVPVKSPAMLAAGQSGGREIVPPWGL